LQSNNKEGREKARSLVMYSVIAFVFLIIFWGVINLLSSSLGLSGTAQPQSDYMQQNNSNGFEFLGDDPCATNPSSPGCSDNASTG